jgi:hypothetical protein
MNRFIGSLPIVTTLSYHNFKIAVTITHKQLKYSADTIKSSTVEVPWTTFLRLTEESLTELLYDWRFTANQFVLAPVWVWVTLGPTASQPVCLGIKPPSGAYDQIFITVRLLRVCLYGEPFLTRGRVCRLQLHSVFAQSPSASYIGSAWTA